MDQDKQTRRAHWLGVGIVVVILAIVVWVMIFPRVTGYSAPAGVWLDGQKLQMAPADEPIRLTDTDNYNPVAGRNWDIVVYDEPQPVGLTAMGHQLDDPMPVFVISATPIKSDPTAVTFRITAPSVPETRFVVLSVDRDRHYILFVTD